MPRLNDVTEEQRDRVRQLWAAGELRDEIARTMGWQIDFFNRLRTLLKLPPRPRYGSRQHVPDPPSQAEIRSLCRRIREKWTPEETALRAGYPPLDADPARNSIRAHRIVPISEIATTWDR
jgi:hypothetical protein